MALADGVFAFAITLLAAEISPTAPVGASLERLWQALAPQLDAYGLSFVVISVYWLAHRRFMALIHSVDPPITVITLAMLGLVALLPATTRLTHAQNASPASMLVYGGLVVAIGVSLAALWGYAALIARVAPDEISNRERWFTFWLVLVTPPLFLILTVAVPAPIAGEVPLALTGLFLIGWRLRLWAAKRIGTDG